ncbi:Hypp472 [Branchiostoma lanceolatum]|uniref:Hypp472 protein n=1 Tax=Branchiostoma lanceolatum TaxID=7740 RepID=A0A8J9W0J5_BRALA|nr:Hypp472 [Branchiostoma lanceolatum]
MTKERINCPSGVNPTEIAAAIHKGVSERDRLLLQYALDKILNQAPWVWKNSELTVIGDDKEWVFYCGSPSNLFVVYHDGNDAQASKWSSKGWKLFLHEGASDIWSWVKGVAEKYVIGKIDNFVRNAIEWYKLG